MKALTLLFAFGSLQFALIQSFSAQSGTVIEGVVLESETDRPMEHVQVSVLTTSAPFQIGSALPIYAQGTTNSDGQFKIDVKPGRYRIVPSLEGYVFSRPPQFRSPREPGIWVEVLQRPALKALEVRMIRASTITGRAVNAAGQPLRADSNVGLARYCYNDYGERLLCPIPGASSPGSGRFSSGLDDRGQFRFYGLQSGDYYIRFFNAGPIGSPRTTYFPGTLDEAAAVPVQIEAGKEVNLGVIPVRQPLIKGVRVRFHYTDDGSVPGNREVRIAGTTILANNRPGEVLVQGVAPGQYDGVVTVGMRATNRTSAAFYSLFHLNVVDTDIDQELTMLRAIRVSATFNVAGLNCYLHSTNTTSSCDSWLVPGFYRLELQGIPTDSYVVSAKLGGRNILPDGVQVDSDAALQIEMATPGGIVIGAVKDSNGEIVSSAVVALVPDAPLRAAGPLYRSATCDVNGGFELHGIAPGAYHLFAWLELEGAAYRNPLFMKPFEEKGVPIRIEQASRTSVDLKIADEPPISPK